MIRQRREAEAKAWLSAAIKPESHEPLEARLQVGCGAEPGRRAES
jgi:hypothetical protein